MALALEPGKLALREGAPESTVALCRPQVIGSLPLTDTLDLRLRNGLATSASISLRGNRPRDPTASVSAGGEDTLKIGLHYPGTLLAEFLPARCVAALVIPETSPSTADRDEVMLIEEWRVRADGSTVPPGLDLTDAKAVFTLNRKLLPEIAVRRFERVRFRFINASPRSVIALRIENQNAQFAQDMRVMANDSRPAEPFLARNGQIALAPGARLDAFVDMSGDTGSSATLLLHDGVTARPLARIVYGGEALRAAPLADPAPLSERPSLRPILRDAQRLELVYDGSPGDGPQPNASGTIRMTVQPAVPPTAIAFSAMRGRTVTLALVNRSSKPAIFRLYNHHARLLDRLDDGWKPYWTDTIAVDAGQTQRIAFVPETAGNFFIEAFAPEWSSQLWRRNFIVLAPA